MTRCILAATCLSVLYGGVCGGRQRLEQCTQDNFMVCWEPMRDVYSEMHSAIVPTLSPTELEEHCQIYEDAMDCFSSIYRSCPPQHRSFLEGIDDGYAWLCHESRNEYIAYRGCFADVNLHREGVFCNNSLSRRLREIDYNSPFNYQRQRMCQYYNDYLDCVQNAVTSFCGSVAGSWQRELDTRLMEPLLNGAYCRLHEDGVVYYGGTVAPHTIHRGDTHDDEMSFRTVVMLGVIASLAGMVIILAISYVVRKNKITRVSSTARRGVRTNRQRVQFVAAAHGADATARYAEPLPQKTASGLVVAPAYSAEMPPVEGGAYVNENLYTGAISPPPAYDRV